MRFERGAPTDKNTQQHNTGNDGMEVAVRNRTAAATGQMIGRKYYSDIKAA